MKNLSPAKRELLLQAMRKQAPVTAEARSIPRRDTQEPPPLSFAQERLWFLHQMMDDKSVYNMPGHVLLNGELDVDALSRALSEVIRRHEPLRTSFSHSNGSPLQLISPSIDLLLPLTNLSHLSPDARASQAASLADTHARTPFDLSRPPLLRAHLLRLSSTEHHLLLTLHHTIADGWSVRILVRELALLYEAFRSGKDSPLADLPIQYADYSVWQRERLQGSVLDEELAYWRERLANAPAVLELPTDRARPAVQSFRGARRAVRVGEETARGVRELARRCGATPYMVLLAAFKTLLWRYTGQSDVVVGTPVANRGRAELEGLIGYFANTLVLRTDVSGEPSFSEVVRRVREVTLGAYGHQEVPFEKLVEELRPERSLSHNPLFQVLFSLQSTSVSSQSIPGLQLEFLNVNMGTTRFDLALELLEEENFSGSFEYSTDLFDAETVDRMAEHYQVMLENIVKDPDQPISALPLLTEAGRIELLSAAGGMEPVGAASAGPACLHRSFEEQARRRPGSICVSFGARSITYRELDAKANQLARHLRRKGIGPEVPVGIIAERSLEMVLAMLAVLKAGGAYVPLDPSYPKERLAFMLAELDSPVLLTQGRLLDALPHVKNAHAINLDDWEAFADESEEALDVLVSPANTAYVIYTSGSTGRPKGVQISHQSATHLFEVSRSHFNFDERDVWTVFHSYAFDFSVWEIWAPLTYGARLVIVPTEVAQSPGDFHELLRRERVTILNQTPSALRQLVETREELAGETREWSLRLLICGGEALPPSLVPRLLEWNVPVWNFYGPTEATVWSSIHRVESTDALSRSVPIGRPLPDVGLYVLDVNLQPVPTGVRGELYISGHGLARGYLARPSLTAQRFIPDPFSQSPGSRLYRTGDAARWLSNGEVEFLGRVDEQLKVRGFRVEPAEIEAALCRHPLVREAAVVAQRMERSGTEQLVAYVVCAEGVEEERAIVGELRVYAREVLPGYMVPSAIVVLDSLPLTPNGKLDRRALPAPDQLRPDLMVDYVAPRNELECAIAAIWQEVLQIEKVGVNDNFFELGGHSLLLVRAHQQLKTSIDAGLTMVEMFQYPTVAALAKHLGQKTGEPSSVARDENARQYGADAKQSAAGVVTDSEFKSEGDAAANEEREIAVVGMVCRFPGAKDVEEFWRNLRDGVESVNFFSDEELKAEGINPDALGRPDYVKAASLLEGVELFDAAFFGFSHREAELLDPQHRLFLEGSWEALESAGYDPEKYDGRVGVFAGAGLNTYGLRNLFLNPGVIDAVGGFQALITNDKDYLSTRASYKLNLRGPSINVNTACSTSLVAVHMACRSLLSGECDMALAGGVSVKVPQKTGYFYQKDGVLSPDGHCRAFDARAQGTVFGSGMGIVVLKRLRDALRDGDRIHAIVKGSATNNDGGLKVGFTAPSVEGQAEVIGQALAAAGIGPRTVTYVETHGTATPLGDPVEVAGLTKAFGPRAGRDNLCALGSVKTNFGHLDTAAGVAGMIKVILSLGHQAIPPTLHFERPNPNIDFESGPFYVNAQLAEWKTSNYPRRAGVSSFGVGGTNAHVILEEAPEVETDPPRRPWQVLFLSGKTETALERVTDNLVSHLTEHPELEIADVAYTLHAGRRHFSHRRTLVCRDRLDAIEALGRRDPARVLSSVYAGTEEAVAFMFPGVGDHYVNMGRELYRTEQAFREQVDLCSELLRPHLGADLREALYPSSSELVETSTHSQRVATAPAPSGIDLRKMLRPHAALEDEAERRLNQPSLVQPALFVIEYALARLCMSWGIVPRALIGYSLGEYTAACLAGIFSLEDALRLVARRAQMIAALPAGAMLAVPLPEHEVRRELGEELALAAINGPSLCVVSGSLERVADLEHRLGEMGVASRRLRASHAFHSPLMEPIVEPLVELLKEIRLAPPRIPCVSNLTGRWITPEEATDPRFLAQQLSQTVHFAEGLRELLKEPGRILLEVGPGQNLSSMAIQLLDRDGGDRQGVFPLLRHSYDNQHDAAYLLRAVGQLWLSGVEVNHSGFYAGERRRRVPLPTYPFERQRYWIDSRKAHTAEPSTPELENAGLTEAGQFYVPGWKRSPPFELPASAQGSNDVGSWLILADDSDFSSRLIESLRRDPRQFIVARVGPRFDRLDENAYTLDPREPNDYKALLSALRERGSTITKVVHLLGAAPQPQATSEDASREIGFESLFNLMRTLTEHKPSARLSLDVLVNNAFEVTGHESLSPEASMVEGLCQFIQEISHAITCRVFDVELPEAGARSIRRLSDRLARELAIEPVERVVAYRGDYRWTATREPIRAENRGPLPTKEGGVYLISGGLNDTGLSWAKYLAGAVRPRLILSGRASLPERSEWERIVAGNGDNPQGHLIRELLALESAGAEIWLDAQEASGPRQLHAQVERIHQRYGALDGVIFAATVSAESSAHAATMSAGEARGELLSLASELKAMETALDGRDVSFCLLLTSRSAVGTQAHQIIEAAARSLTQNFVLAHNRVSDVTWTAVHADAWPRADETDAREVFDRILSLASEPLIYLAAGEPTSDGNARAARHGAADETKRPADETPALPLHMRENLRNPYVAPSNPTEARLAQIWQELLGVARVGVHDNLFELGAHSLLAAQFIARLKEVFPIEPSLRTIYEAPTVSELALVVEEMLIAKIEQLSESEVERLISER
jgi:amino acid adenylation domain-containing protein